jgi:hypothetical protein
MFRSVSELIGYDKARVIWSLSPELKELAIDRVMIMTFKNSLDRLQADRPPVAEANDLQSLPWQNVQHNGNTFPPPTEHNGNTLPPPTEHFNVIPAPIELPRLPLFSLQQDVEIGEGAFEVQKELFGSSTAKRLKLLRHSLTKAMDINDLVLVVADGQHPKIRLSPTELDARTQLHDLATRFEDHRGQM